MASWTRPAVFGASDGMMSILGVVFYLGANQGLIVPAATIGGISSALSMAVGEWLSDSEHGLGASCIMGGATGVGTVIPAAPYLAWHGVAALMLSTVLCIVLAVVVGLIRETPAQRWQRVWVTVGTLGVVYGVTLTCARLGGG